MKTSGSFKPGQKVGETWDKVRAGRKGARKSPWRFFALQGVQRRDEQRAVGPDRGRARG